MTPFLPFGRPAAAPTVKARLTAVMSEVRKATREAAQTARSDARRGKGSYADCLARLYEEWIRFSVGRARLIHIASAAEAGLLSLHHLQLGEQALEHIDDHAVRTMFWATARRWQQAMPRMREAST